MTDMRGALSAGVREALMQDIAGASCGSSVFHPKQTLRGGIAWRDSSGGMLHHKACFPERVDASFSQLRG